MAWNEAIKKSLGHCGEQVYIGENVIFTSPEHVHLGDRVRIDPFTLITTSLVAGSNIQICSHSVLSGGRTSLVRMDDWTFIGYHSEIFCGSEDYSGAAGPVNAFWGKNEIRQGNVHFKKFSGIASSVTVFPGVTFPEGCTIGARSLVYSGEILREWSVWVGNPLAFRKARNMDTVKQLSKDSRFLISHEQ